MNLPLDTSPDAPLGNEIAVVGMAGRFPGAANVSELWANLVAGRESIRAFSLEELVARGVDPAAAADPAYVRAGAELPGTELFDAHFFGYSPGEAEMMDPQHRLFLEVAWEAFEDAGRDPARMPGRTGVFAGAGFNAYLLLQLAAQADVQAALRGHQIGEQLRVLLANAADFLATRVAYKLGLTGVSLTVQTACSTSLVAIHLACQSLLAGECDAALAGGVAIHLNQSTGYHASPGSIASPDGHCRAFDAAAAGTVFGSGVGAVVLKRLEDAVAGGDRIYAVVRGSAVNNDGAQKVGYTAPSVAGQSEVIAEALANAGVDPETIGLVEAHGTGTPLGDPVEIEALRQAFAGSPAGTCAIGSVKTNIGHLDAAAGVAGFIKAALAVERGVLPPSLHFVTPNPAIDFAASPFYVNAELRSWERGTTPRRAGISSFGIGGTNVHVVLEQPPEPIPVSPARPWLLLPLSARTASALEAATANLAAHLESPPLAELAAPLAASLADIAYTLQVGRHSFEHRRAVLARSSHNVEALGETVEALRGERPERLLNGQIEEGERPVAFLFPGQGTQYPGMAAGLYASEPVFRQLYDRCADLLAPLLSFDLRRTLRDDDRETGLRLAETAIAQPALFTVEYALARLWMSWGVRPAALLGHSLGELVAACLAEVLSLEDALSLVAERGRLMQELPEGAMLALPLPAGEAAALLAQLGPELSLAAENGPAQSTVAGPVAAVEELARRLAEQGIAARRLPAERAFHSRQMEALAAPFAARFAALARRAPRIPYLSNRTGTWVRAEDAVDPAAWGEHLCRPVRFATALGELLSRPRLALLEVGPGRTLSRLARRHPACTEDRGVTASMRASTDALPDEAVLMTALGRLWVAGVEVDWNAFSSGQTRRRVGLPTYPFERQRYWADAGHSFSPVTAAPPETSSGYRRPDLATPFLAPRDETEAALAGIWQRVLGIARVGVHDSFLELGGDSLLAAQVISRVREEMAVDLPAHHVFTADTLAELAPLVRQLAAGQREAERLKSELLAALEELSEDEVESELTRRAVIEIGGDR